MSVRPEQPEDLASLYRRTFADYGVRALWNLRPSRFTAEEFQAVATEEPVDVPGLHHRIRSMIKDAETFIAKLPSEAVGVIFMDGERPVQPDVNALDQYQRNPGATRGFWPSSPEISRATIERYGKPKT